jgi:pilus assembly protein CpaD
MTKIAFKSLATIAVLAIGACTHDAEVYDRMTPVSVRHPITVEPSIRELQISAGAHGLTEADRLRVRAVAREYLAVGHGPFVIASAGGRTQADAIAAAQKEGVSRDRIEIATYHGGSGAVISYTMYTATGPECGNFGEDITFSPENKSSPNFGCATQKNMAAMLEDPRDLIAPRGEEPASSARRATVIKAYREGQNTAAARTDQDSGAVSTVGR